MERQARRQHLDASAAQSGGAIRTPLRVHQQRHVGRKLQVFTEGGGKMSRPVPDQDQLATAPADLVLFVAQLRDLLAAEESAEVAQEHQHDGAR